MKNNQANLVDALYAGTQSAILAFDGEVERHIEDRKFFEGDFKETYVNTVVQDGVAFLLGSEKNTDRETWKTCRLKPTAVLFKNGESLFLWVLEKPIAEADAAPIAAALGMERADEFIPLPPTNGWELIHCDKDQYYALKDLQSAYAPAAKTPVGASREAVRQKYKDAVCLTPYDPADPRYQQEIIISAAGSREATNWRPTPMPLPKFIDLLAVHKEGKKDGPAYVPGDMVEGRRLKPGMKALYGATLDIDNGRSTEKNNDALVELGCLAVQYSTHSHGKTKSEFKKDAIIKFAPDEEVSTETIRKYLREKEQWDETIVESAEFVGTEHTERGIMAVVSHAQMPKNRIFIPFKEPFIIANEGATQQAAMEKWSKIPLALAEKLGIQIDRTGTDPSRLFYFSRHDKNRPHATSIIGGGLFDWRTGLDLDDPYEALGKAVTKGTSKSKTAEGRELARWSMRAAHGFQIVDCIEEYCPDKIRGIGSNGKDIECPFDENHNNAGDPDDRACFAVNAGEGSTDFYTVSCRHDSCQGKTMLDMTGKMVKDGWFPREALDDERFNAAVADDAPKPEAAKRVEREDKVREEYLNTINNLNPDSSDEDIDAAAMIIVQADLSPVPKDRAIVALAKNLDIRKPIALKTLKMAEKALAAQSRKDKAASGGPAIFRYTGGVPDFPDAVAYCVAALQAKNKKDQRPTFCHISGNPMRLKEKDGRMSFEKMDAIALWSELNNLVAFVHCDGEFENEREMVPKEVAQHICEQAESTLPVAPEIIYTPIFLKNGGLIEAPKFHFDREHELNHVLCLNGLKIPPIPNPPTRLDMEASLQWLRVELLNDFPLLDHDLNGKEDRAPGEANALAMFLTPFMRKMIDGRTPLFFVTKPTAGTGGTLLASLPIMIFDGAKSGVRHVDYSASEDEMGKRAVAEMMAARSYFFFDDVEDFNNRFIIRALTSSMVSGRELGYSRIVAQPNFFHWSAAANNTDVGEEMARRICWIRLNAKKADVKDRVFRHSIKKDKETGVVTGETMEQFVTENRGVAVGHILTLIDYWLAEGAIKFTDRGLPSFDDWAAKVGGVLQACGVEGFLNNRAPVAVDRRAAADIELLQTWVKQKGQVELSSKDLFKLAVEHVLAVLNGRSDDEKRANFDRTLRRLVGRVFEFDGKEYEVKAKDTDAGLVFHVEAMEKISHVT